MSLTPLLLKLNVTERLEFEAARPQIQVRSGVELEEEGGEAHRTKAGETKYIKESGVFQVRNNAEKSTRNQARRSTPHRRHEIFQASPGAETLHFPLDSRHVKAGDSDTFPGVARCKNFAFSTRLQAC